MGSSAAGQWTAEPVSETLTHIRKIWQKKKKCCVGRFFWCMDFSLASPPLSLSFSFFLLLFFHTHTRVCMFKTTARKTCH
jgi:hypothetical protein